MSPYIMKSGGRTFVVVPPPSGKMWLVHVDDYKDRKVELVLPIDSLKEAEEYLTLMMLSGKIQLV